SAELAIPAKPIKRKEFAIYDEADSIGRLADRRDVLEYGSSVGPEDADGDNNEIRAPARSGVRERGSTGVMHLLLFFVPVGFAMVIVVMTGILIGASLPTNLP